MNLYNKIVAAINIGLTVALLVTYNESLAGFTIGWALGGIFINVVNKGPMTRKK